MRRGQPNFLARVQPLPCVLIALKKNISRDGGVLVSVSTDLGLWPQLLMARGSFPRP